ncbi:hypothetical protein KY337_00260 [Candidatus Woesearchaeota archaeon]|nr:hypothetical protein [Candidatus Woesearchaeota archaeon]
MDGLSSVNWERWNIPIDITKPSGLVVLEEPLRVVVHAFGNNEELTKRFPAYVSLISQKSEDEGVSSLDYLLRMKKELRDLRKKGLTGPDRILTHLQPHFALETLIDSSRRIAKPAFSVEEQKVYADKAYLAVEAGIQGDTQDHGIRRVLAYKGLIQNCHNHGRAVAEALLEGSLAFEYLKLRKGQGSALWQFLWVDHEFETEYTGMLSFGHNWKSGKVVKDIAEAKRRANRCDSVIKKVTELQERFKGEYKDVQPVASALKHIAKGFKALYSISANYDPEVERDLVDTLAYFHQVYLSRD